MKTHRFTILAALLVGNASTVVASNLQALLATDRNWTIPGLPVTFNVTLINDTDQTVAAPRAIAAEVTTSDGDQFRAAYGEPPRELNSWPSEYKDSLLLPPHTQRAFEIPAQQNVFFEDARLARVGRYQIALILGSATNEPPEGQLRTNTVSLKVDEPSGEDRKVWQWMKATAGNQTWGPVEWARFRKALEDEVFAQHIRSRYAPFVYFANISGRTLNRLQQLSAYHGGGPFGDWIQFESAGYQIRMTREELNKPPGTRNATRAIRAAEEANRILSTLEQSTSEDLIRHKIEIQREYTPTVAGVRAAVIENH